MRIVASGLQLVGLIVVFFCLLVEFGFLWDKFMGTKPTLVVWNSSGTFLEAPISLFCISATMHYHQSTMLSEQQVLNKKMSELNNEISTNVGF
mmetsp:Transcript_17372/g.40337  ORF Transcript_17372/g.40337 Transcript_17372/m.40337 type:complete len:93 (-) Transcript_17372:598-876(-)